MGRDPWKLDALRQKHRSEARVTNAVTANSGKVRARHHTEHCEYSLIIFIPCCQRLEKKEAVIPR